MKIIKIVLFTVTIMMYSCTMWRGEPEDTQIDFTVKNVSTHNVKLKVFNAFFDFVGKDTTFLLPINSEITYQYTNIVGYPFGGGEDSAYIIFDNVKQIIYRRDDGKLRNILDIKSYIGGEVKEYWYQYRYEITNEDYANAVEIK